MEQCAEAKEVVNAASDIPDVKLSTETLEEATAEPVDASAATTVRVADAREVSSDAYHEGLQVLNFDTIEEVEKYYTEHWQVLSGQYGVMLFLYSVLLTKVRF